ncbi:MAG TPA: S26 family signal peptidase [Pirellulaceae bacterium]|nr:S26 family signal peptidase [Pirellulaceae bacterium]HMO91607.1 S26 family signal peptidase [Pirellulaceae bacterium]HMP68304.1 S26 family signal peptidase [Pirellulaceae bacterium]
MELRPPDKFPIQTIDGGSKVDRWEVIAFADPRSDGYLVKRVIGLPGEQISFDAGNLMVDQRLVRKPYHSNWMAVLPTVFQFDERIRLQPERFAALNDDTNWVLCEHDLKFVGGSVPPDVRKGKRPSRYDAAHPAFIAGDEVNDEIDWLLYRHRKCYFRNAASTPHTIDDFYGINHHLTRETNSVCEIAIRLSLECVERGILVLRIHDGFEYHTFDIDFDDICLRYRDKSFAIPFQVGAKKPLDLTVWLIDQQLDFIIDEIPIVHVEFERQGGGEAVADVAALGGVSGEFIIRDFSLHRDWFLFDPRSEPTHTWSLAQGEYFVVGDNLPISRDSREWQGRHLTRAQILGRIKHR